MPMRQAAAGRSRRRPPEDGGIKGTEAPSSPFPLPARHPEVNTPQSNLSLFPWLHRGPAVVGELCKLAKEEPMWGVGWEGLGLPRFPLTWPWPISPSPRLPDKLYPTKKLTFPLRGRVCVQSFKFIHKPPRFVKPDGPLVLMPRKSTPAAA
jgi:hypothetical protein